MKKLSKTLLAIAAISAASMAMTASAMAMTADYADGTVTLSDVKATGASQTLLIVNEEGVTVDSSNASDVVEQIDQKDDGTSFASVPVGTLADGTYEVRIGGTDGSMQKTTFTVGEVEPGEKTIMIGDTDSNGRIMMNDASNIATKSLYQDTAENGTVGTTYTYVSGLDTAPESGTIMIGDTDLNERIMMNDATNVATKSLYQDTTENQYVGQNVTVSEAE